MDKSVNKKQINLLIVLIEDLIFLCCLTAEKSRNYNWNTSGKPQFNLPHGPSGMGPRVLPPQIPDKLPTYASGYPNKRDRQIQK